MADRHVEFAGIRAIVTEQPAFKPGDLPPEGYLAWHEWAEVQRKAGIKQVQCGICAKWKTPQELSGMTVTTMASRTKRGPRNVALTSPVCTKCAPDTERRG